MKKGWTETKLGEVCEFEGGSQPPKSTFSTIEKEGYVRLIQIRDYKTDKHKVYIPLSKARRFCKKDDIMIGRYGPPVFQILEGLEGAYNVALMKAVPNKEKVTRDYIFLFLQHHEIQQHIINLSQRASGQTGISIDALTAFPIKFPSLSEQQRIVSVLDEAFASIAQAKSNAERNLVNARELFESVLQYEFENAGKDWEEKKIKEVGIAQTGTTPKTANKENYGDFIPFIKPADIDILGDGEIRYDNDGLSEEGLGNGRKILGGSVLMVCIGASIGKVGFVDRDVTCNQQINTLTVNPGLYPKFFYYALRTQGFYNQVIKNSAQMTLPIINKSKWENLTVHYPKSLAEQRAIVGRLEALSAETGRLEEIYWQKVESLEELKKSVLAKAFEGEI